MGFEIAIDVDYFDHPKTLHLIGLIGPEADIYPIRLWKFCAKYRKNGSFPSDSPDLIEQACGWKGRGKPRGRLIDALVKSGFVVTPPNHLTYEIHDWMKGIGRDIALYERKKQIQRDKYWQEKGSLPQEKGRKSHTQDTLPYSTQEGIPEAPSHATHQDPGGSAPPAPQDDPALQQLVDAYAFCGTPGPEAKSRAFADLLRQGVSFDRILKLPESGTIQTQDFFQIVRLLTPDAKPTTSRNGPHPKKKGGLCKHEDRKTLRDDPKRGETLVECANPQCDYCAPPWREWVPTKPTKTRKPRTGSRN